MQIRAAHFETKSTTIPRLKCSFCALFFNQLGNYFNIQTREQLTKAYDSPIEPVECVEKLKMV